MTHEKRETKMNQPKTQGKTTEKAPTTTKNTSEKTKLLSVMTGLPKHGTRWARA